jgi:hypothetical protein
MMLRSKADWPVTFMPYLQYSIDMIQDYHQKQLLQEPSVTTLTTMMSSSYLNKVVISLDCIQIGNVVRESSDRIIIDSSNGNQFAIPSCKVISIDNTINNNLILDIVFQEVGRYRMVEAI